MRSDIPFIAFSLRDGEDDALHTTLFDRRALERKKPEYEDTLSTLAALNERGQDEAATMIGKWVLMMLNNSYPDKFSAYPNLVVEVRPPPSPERIAAIEAELDRQDKEDKV
jgi:hypothetical protein